MNTIGCKTLQRFVDRGATAEIGEIGGGPDSIGIGCDAQEDANP